MEALEFALDSVLLVLAVFGGVGNDWRDLIIRHLLPAIMWVAVFISGWSLSRYRPTTRDRLLLIAVALAFSYEAVHFLYICLQQSYQQFFIVEVVLSAWLVLVHVFLATAIAQFIPALGPKPLFGIYVKRSVIAVAIAAVLTCAHWLYASGGDPHQSFKSSAGYLVLLVVHAAVLIGALVFLWRVRTASQTGRIAWIPFAMFFMAIIFLVTNAVSGGQHAFGLNTVANNLLIWATPWFGYVYWRDVVEEQKHIATRLHQAERLDVMGSLAAGVAHDFNNHLQAMMGYAEVGRDAAEQMGTARTSFDNILESIERAGVLVRQLMAFQRQDSTGQVEALNLVDVVADLAPMLNALTGSRVSIINELNPKVDYLFADRSKLEQAIINISVNARDAMPNGGLMTIKSKRLPVLDDGSPPVLRITITDTGEGMSAIDQARVFEPFYTTKGAGGTGLGLAASMTAIKTMGGSMTIESELGKGTTLVIDLLAADVPDEHTVPPEDDQSKEIDLSLFFGTERVLVAEDEPALRHIASIQLKRGGYQVGVARDGLHAMDMLARAEEPYDLVLMDVMMPRMDGYTTYHEIRKLYPDLPVIFASAHADPQRKDIPDAPHIAKPYHRRSLVMLVRKTLNEAAAKRT